MLTSIVMTIFGPDRPGLVEAVAGLINAHGGNWLESRLSHLGGHFAGIVRIEVDDSRRAELLAALQDGAVDGLSIVVQERMVERAPAPDDAGRRRMTLAVVGHDRPGIVRQISSVLAQQGVNVEELVTQRTSAPMSGESIFQARAEVSLPPATNPADVRARLEKIASDLMVDLDLSPAGED